MKPTAILLCGLPYAGKSTLAEALVEDGYAVISLNSINHERGLGLDGVPVPGSEWMETHRIALERLCAYLRAGHSVVWDDSNYAAFIRDPIFEAAIEAGGDPVMVFVEAPLDVVRARGEDVAERGHRPICPAEDFERVVRDFERPCCGIRVDGTMKPEAAAALVRKALHRSAAVMA